MTDGPDRLTVAALGLALDAAALRQQAAATNLANHAAEGFVPQRVSFEAQLQRAREALAAGASLHAGDLAGVSPKLEPSIDAHGVPAKVELDAEVAEMARNAVHYQALARTLNRHFGILTLAVNDGRR